MPFAWPTPIQPRSFPFDCFQSNAFPSLPPVQRGRAGAAARRLRVVPLLVEQAGAHVYLGGRLGSGQCGNGRTGKVPGSLDGGSKPLRCLFRDLGHGLSRGRDPAVGRRDRVGLRSYAQVDDYGVSCLVQQYRPTTRSHGVVGVLRHPDRKGSSVNTQLS